MKQTGSKKRSPKLPPDAAIKTTKQKYMNFMPSNIKLFEPKKALFGEYEIK